MRPNQIIMNTIFSCMLLLFFSNPVSLFANDDTDDAAGVVFIEGTLKIDDQGVYLESTDCLYPGKYYLGGVLNENTGQKKDDKANIKSNKKVAKQIKKTASMIGKAENKTLTNQEIKGFFGAREGYLSPVKVISPMFEPIATGLSPACDLTLGAIYLLYLETQRIKALSRVVSSKSVTSEDKMEESLKFYDSPQNGCKEIGMDELKIKSADIKSVLKEANAAVALNLVAIGAVLVNMPTIEAEVNAASPMQKMAGMASIAQAVAFQARLLGDNKRLQDRIKEAEGIMEMVDKL